ncbi:hypothetical protein A5881_002313 [Enterococcus termitis]|nr:hypothetical protein A5881_001369 [Enterococcus termitis]
MYNLGYLTIAKEQFESKEKLATDDYQIIHLIENDLSDLDELDGLVIEDSKHTDMSKICDVLLKIKKISDIPVWIITSIEKTSQTTRLVYLKLGAAGLINYNVDKEEISLTIKNTLQRLETIKMVQQKEEETKKENVSFQLVPKNFSVKVGNDNEISLTRLEYKTLEFLYQHIKEVVTYDELYENVWNDHQGKKIYRVTNLVFKLREKFEHEGCEHQYIKTVRSKGYMLNL